MMLKEHAYYHTSYYIFRPTRHQSAQFLSMPPQSGSLLYHSPQTEQLESIQKKQYIFNFIRGMSYPNLLFVVNINSLKDR